MENRLKTGLRPRPKIGLGGTVQDSAVQKVPSRATARTSLMQAPVLVLNATFEPINVTAVRRALVLVLKGVAQAEETNHTEVHSTSRAVQVPSVIRLLSYRHIPQQSRALYFERTFCCAIEILASFAARLCPLRSSLWTT